MTLPAAADCNLSLCLPAGFPSLKSRLQRRLYRPDRKIMKIERI